MTTPHNIIKEGRKLEEKYLEDGGDYDHNPVDGLKSLIDSRLLSVIDWLITEEENGKKDIGMNNSRMNNAYCYGKIQAIDDSLARLKELREAIIN